MKKINYFKTTIIIIFISIISLAFIKLDDGDDFELIKNLEIYHSVLKELRLNYVDEVNVSELITFSIHQMLLQLDPFTNYYPENLVEDYTFSNSGEFGGTGMTVEKIDNEFVVTDLIVDKPAYIAGVKIGNKLIEVENINIKDKSLEEVSSLLKGESGSIVGIKIIDAYNSTIELKITREQISSTNVSYYTVFDNNIGYIKVENFLFNAGDDVKNAFIELKNSNDLNGLILDFRGNPGGLLIEAVKIVNIFVEKDVEIVRMSGKSLQSNNIFYTTEDPIDLEIPIVVLINPRSASASEIVSGALQDLDRAVIVGQRSYGKGLVQITKDLAYNTKMKITTANYYIPSGRCIQANKNVIRNENMEIIFVPDSILKEFNTKNGRKVYDGAGIFPDVFVQTTLDNEFIDSLNKNFIFFVFANTMVSVNDKIDAPKTFVVTDEIYNDFINFANENFNFKSEISKEVEYLKQITDKNEYQQSNKKIDELKEEILIEEENLFTAYKDEIKTQIGLEIMNQNFYKEGKLIFDLYNGPEVKKALEILNDPANFNLIIGTKN